MDHPDPASVEATVMDVVAEVLNEPVAAIRDVPVLAAHAWDSIASLEVLAQLESVLEVTLDLRAFNSVRTVAELVDVVRAAGENARP
jgi:acyl carrier protein